jgi:hypothetical protein
MFTYAVYEKKTGKIVHGYDCTDHPSSPMIQDWLEAFESGTHNYMPVAGITKVTDDHCIVFETHFEV